jgi:hypothetical protein
MSDRTVIRLHLGSVRLPNGHPRAHQGRCEIYSFAVAHPEGLILVDTVPGDDHPIVNERYQPDVVSVVDALNRAGLDFSSPPGKGDEIGE